MLRQIRGPVRLLLYIVIASSATSLLLVLTYMKPTEIQKNNQVPEVSGKEGPVIENGGGVHEYLVKTKINNQNDQLYGPAKLSETVKLTEPAKINTDKQNGGFSETIQIQENTVTNKIKPVDQLHQVNSSSTHDYFRNLEFRTGQFGSKRETDIEHALHKLHGLKCPQVVRPPSSRIGYHQKFLQLYTSVRYYIYLYSAYYDDRPYTGLLPVIRILAVSSPLQSSTYCLVWYEGIDHPVQILMQHRKNGHGHNIEGKRHEQYFFTCQLPVAYPRPTHVSVVSRECEQPRNYLPVYHPVKSSWSHEFGVCGPVSYGNLNVYRLVEWIEIYRHFGVTEFTMYASTVNGSRLNKEVMDALVYYENQGIVDLHYLPPPREVNNNDNIQVASMAVLNDCILRNMYRYRYAIIVDLDDIIVPRIDKTYGDMLQRIDKEMKLTEPSPSYTMRNAYFWTSCDASQTPQEYTNFFALKYLKRDKPSPYLFISKSFIDPRTCLSVFNHYCWIRFPQVKDPFSIDVPTHIGLSHHYRKFRERKEGQCEKFARDGIQDDTVLKYKDVLTNNIEAVLGQIGVIL